MTTVDLAAAAPLLDADPRQLGPWRLLGRLGSGGTGTAYLARDRAGRQAAVKTVHAHLLAEPAARARFQREVEVASRVDSPAVARVLDADAAAQPPWLATEHVPGATLRSVVDRSGALGFADWSGLAVRLLDAVAAVHALDVVHRDLSPSNVIMSPDGPRLIDFGLALLATSPRMTAAGDVHGTPGFVSPEQVEGHEATSASDVFTVGCVLALAATGRPPFGEGTARELAHRAVARAIDVDGLPVRQRRFLEQLTAREPGDRPSAARAAAEWAEVAELTVALPPLGPQTRAARTLLATRVMTTTSAAPVPPPAPPAPRSEPVPVPVLAPVPVHAAGRRGALVPLLAAALVTGFVTGALAAGPGRSAEPAAAPAPSRASSSVTAPPTTTVAPSPTARPAAAATGSPTPSTSSASSAGGTPVTSMTPAPSLVAAPQVTAPVTRETSTRMPAATASPAYAALAPSGDPTTSAQLAAAQAAALARTYSFAGGSVVVRRIVPNDHATTSGSVDLAITTGFNQVFNGGVDTGPGYALVVSTTGMGASAARYSTCLRQLAGTTTTVTAPALSDTAMGRWTSITVGVETDAYCSYDDPTLPPTTPLVLSEASS